MKFTFDVSKCDKIFNELLSIKKIKLSHTIPPIEELRKRAYYKWHNSHSHATNDCNVLRRQVQLAINEGQLCLKKMQVDNDPFLDSIIDLQGAKVLVRPEQAELISKMWSSAKKGPRATRIRFGQRKSC
jgi:hypothetical protein